MREKERERERDRERERAKNGTLYGWFTRNFVGGEFLQGKPELSSG